MNTTKFLALGFMATALTACGGYSAMYKDNQAFNDVALGTIQMTKAEKNVGERRVAQWMRQELLKNFPSQATDQYVLNIDITETTSALAVRRDATVERSTLSLVANFEVYDQQKGAIAFKSTSSTSSAYNTQNTPYSTEAGKLAARQHAAEKLAHEIGQRVLQFFKYKSLKGEE